MKRLAAIVLLILTLNSFSQNSLIGDTILKSFKGDTTIMMIEKLPMFLGYEFVEAGYQPDSITNEIFVIKNKSHHLIIVTEFYRQGINTGNIIIDTLQYPVKLNQRVIFNFCFYDGKENPDIIVVMEDSNGNKLYDQVKMAWEIKKYKRKVITANKKLVGCALDETGN